MDEGIHLNVPESVYRSCDGVSQSELKEFGWAASPLHFKTRKPKVPTPDMEFGTVCHCAILQPELLESSYHLRPEAYPLESKGRIEMKPWHGGSDWCKDWLKKHSDKPVMTKDDMARVDKVASRIRFIPEICAALKSGQKEVSFTKRDPETGLLMKCRTDLMATDASGMTWIFDFKKVQSGDATERAFQKSCADYGYFIQASYYLNVTGASRFVFVAFDDNEPFDACMYEPDNDALAAGYRQWRKLLNEYAVCKQEDVWPGYKSGIQKIEAPKWMKEL